MVNLEEAFYRAEYVFAVGFLLGGYTGARKNHLQFMAEHQHDLPLRTRNDMLQFGRLRNYRTLSGFGIEGFRRGLQMTSIWILYELIQKSSSAFLSLKDFEASPILPDTIAGGICGLTFAWAGKGQRRYYGRKGALIGMSMGLGLGLLRYFHSRNYLSISYFT